MCVSVCLTFQSLVDVVVQVVDSQAVFEAGRVFLDPVSHHKHGHVTVVLLHLAQQRSSGTFRTKVFFISTSSPGSRITGNRNIVLCTFFQPLSLRTENLHFSRTVIIKHEELTSKTCFSVRGEIWGISSPCFPQIKSCSVVCPVSHLHWVTLSFPTTAFIQIFNCTHDCILRTDKM